MKMTVNMVLSFLRRDILNELSYKLSFILQILGIFPLVIMFYFPSSYDETQSR